MQKIGNWNIFVGTKEEYPVAVREGMKVVCAVNRANGYVTHQSVVGWSGRGCNKNNPYYLFKQTDDAIYLNMIDGDDPAYVNDDMINATLEFISSALGNQEKVFIYCSLGESRSPSIALMYLLENDLISTHNSVEDFKSKYYPNYFPKRGNLEYIRKRWF